MEHRGLQLVSHQGITWLESASLARFPWLVHAFSTRVGGVSLLPGGGLNLGFTEGDDPANVVENRRRFFGYLGVDHFSLATLGQIHSSSICKVSREASGKLTYAYLGAPPPQRHEVSPPAGDGTVTNQSAILLAVRTADCLPVLLVDPILRTVAAVHMGWRGALGRILEKAVEHMHCVFGSDPSQLLVTAGPCIQVCCYKVGSEVVGAFYRRFRQAPLFFRDVLIQRQRRASRSEESRAAEARSTSLVCAGSEVALLDLRAVALNQLESVGVPPARVEMADFCTACRTDLFFSHRAEGSHTGRMMAVIGMRPADEQ